MKNFLVIGGTSGIGAALVKRLGHSNQIWIAARHPTGEGEAHHHIQWDASSGETMEGLPERLDGLAYCPGSSRLQPFSRLTDEQFSEDFQINCVGAVRVIRASLAAGNGKWESENHAMFKGTSATFRVECIGNQRQHNGR